MIVYERRDSYEENGFAVYLAEVRTKACWRVEVEIDSACTNPPRYVCLEQGWWSVTFAAEPSEEDVKKAIGILNGVFPAEITIK